MGHAVALGVHHVVLGPLGGDGAEGAEPDGEVHGVDLHAAAPARIQHLLGEMEAGGGGGHRPRVGGVDGLVALGVGQGPVDVRREGQAGVGLRVGEQVHLPNAVDPAVAHLHQLAAAGQQPGTGRHPVTGADQRLPGLSVEALQQDHLHLPAGALVQAQPGGHDPAVVDHEHVPGPEQPWQVPHPVVRDGAGGVGAHQQAGRVPGLGRLLGDGRLRQHVVVGVHRHGHMRAYGQRAPAGEG